MGTRKNQLGRLGILFLAACLGFNLGSCATAKGPAFERAYTAHVHKASVSVVSRKSEDEGVKIESSPSGAAVYIDNGYRGVTPLSLSSADIEYGSHFLRLELSGYRDCQLYVSYLAGERLSVSVGLESLTGYLRVTADPSDTQVTVDGQDLALGELTELAIGSHRLRARRFGYQDEDRVVVIRYREFHDASFELEPAAFQVYGLKLGRRVICPANHGSLGRCRMDFSVSGPGSGSLCVIDKYGNCLRQREYPGFDAWAQTFIFDGRDNEGRVLADGSYTILLECTGQDGRRSKAMESISIDSKAVISYRGLISGLSGLLLAPSPDSLPASSGQVSLVSLYHHGEVDGAEAWLAPTQLGFRRGLGSSGELDLSLGTVLYGDYSLDNLGFSAGFKQGLGQRGPWSLAADIKLSAQVNPAETGAIETDELSNFSGLSLGLPLGLRLGPLSILAEPELKLALNRPYERRDDSSLGAWGYGRVGILLDYQGISGGISLCLRGSPIGESPSLAPPILAGAELHLGLPASPAFLSILGFGEFWAADDYYLSAGLGIGFCY